MDEAECNTLLSAARARLHADADPERARQAARFFPSHPPILGISSGLSRALGRELAQQIRARGDLADAIAVSEALFQSGIMEEAACANELLSAFWRRLGPEHWVLFDHWLDLSTCWATTDSLCLKVIGHLVLRDGPPQEVLRAWAGHAQVWHRRAALVSLARAVRVGKCQAELFGIADHLLGDPDEMVQKAIGWMLKELYKGDAAAMLAYLRERRPRMTRLAFRYACEVLTKDECAHLVAD